MASTARSRPQVMSLSDAAAARMREVLAAKGSENGALRVGVKNAGCAGMSYTMEIVEEAVPGDEVVEDKGVRLLIDPKAVLFLLGTEMDFRKDKLTSGFVFNNPNQVGACGCGESVSLRASGEESAQPTGH